MLTNHPFSKSENFVL